MNDVRGTSTRLATSVIQTSLRARRADFGPSQMQTGSFDLDYSPNGRGQIWCT